LNTKQYPAQFGSIYLIGDPKKRGNLLMRHQESTVQATVVSDEFAITVEETAVAAAYRAAKIQKNNFRRGDQNHEQLLYDIKLETDRQCEQVIVETIRDRFPGHGILTEESGWLAGGSDSEAFWIVDPLDGTVNFWHGLPIFCVSIACYQMPTYLQETNTAPQSSDDFGYPVTGVVLLPYSNELFVASTGKGARFNGRRIWCESITRTTDAVVTMSFGKTPATMNRMTDRLRALLPKVRKVRCLGAVAVELCYVACGFLSGMVYEGIKPWDFAAGGIVLKEAGGFIQTCQVTIDSWQLYAGAPGMRMGLAALVEKY
jgi:fructose-1,6-bisphosphatase/inositol monophosphatase family enzyme